METVRLEDKEDNETAAANVARQGDGETEKPQDKHIESEVDIQGSEESEEEGEIGDS